MAKFTVKIKRIDEMSVEADSLEEAIHKAKDTLGEDCVLNVELANGFEFTNGNNFHGERAIQKIVFDTAFLKAIKTDFKAGELGYVFPQWTGREDGPYLNTYTAVRMAKAILREEGEL